MVLECLRMKFPETIHFSTGMSMSQGIHSEHFMKEKSLGIHFMKKEKDMQVMGRMLLIVQILHLKVYLKI